MKVLFKVLFILYSLLKDTAGLTVAVLYVFEKINNTATRVVIKVIDIAKVRLNGCTNNNPV